MRKIIQICTSAIPASEDNNEWETLYALCDDGTVWYMWRPTHQGAPRKWRKINDVPQYKG